MIAPRDILDFWFEQSGPKTWFTKSDAFDADIRGRFESLTLDLAADASSDKTHKWEAQPDSALALVIALDQFPRNMYRGTKAMFAYDDLSLAAAKRAVEVGHDYKCPQEQRQFFYMPYMHSESLADQTRCVELVEARLSSESTLHHAKMHRRTIERFGRFPHRNEILGRASLPEEIAFLKEGGYAP